MDINELFDKKVVDAILADAKAAGIAEDEVEKVLNTLPNGGKAVPTRGAQPEGELLNLLDGDRETEVNEIAAATGVERAKVNNILLLAAPFILKYLLSSGSSQQSQSSGLLGTLLGAQSQPQAAQASPLLSLLGGQPQASPQNSLLGALLGAQSQPQQQSVSNANTAALLSALLSQQQAQPVQPIQSQTQGMDLGSLLSLMGGASQSQPQSQQSGGMLSALLGLLGGK